MPTSVDLDEWDFDLPADRIARHPSPERDGSRLLHLPLRTPTPTHHRFRDLVDLLRPGDLLVGNDTRVMHARLRARRATGGRVELLVLSVDGHRLDALARPARKLKPGDRLTLADGSGGTVERAAREGVVRLALDRDPHTVMDEQGELPLPPYLERDAEPADRERYQTIYAGQRGAAAAPTAGLHFSRPLLDALATRGIGFTTLTLHVGLGTFRPLRPEDVHRGHLHPETYVVPGPTVDAIRVAKARGGRVVAIGTTTVRALESATRGDASLPDGGHGTTTLFLKPPDRLRVVDGLVTNFHLPRSSLLMLVACLCGRERLLATYRTAITHGYRFYSYGDAMLLL